MRVLVANRGEIAVRVLRAVHALGWTGVAVHSDADAQALHVRLADGAVRLGPAPAAQSYLRQDAVIDAAHATGAQAVHPGYGFLSENATFARRVIKEGLVWVGPPPRAMDAMGDKVKARAAAQKAGVPVSPGSGVLKDADHAADEAARIGYPVMLKASAGGGGIGMRVVRGKKDLAAAFESASKQAASSFGVADVFMEKFIERPRHIEVQVLGDQHGHVVHLYERECSIQRRHQKLVEEAPSPALSQEEREDIGARAVALAKGVGYTNAGTLEFLYEGDPGAPGTFHFNEMNTRLQVEHPVTEAVTGIDIVQWQLRIAAGEELGFSQADVRLDGHAFEARINAEDPRRGFLPSPGPVARLRWPHGRGVRVDAGIVEGWTVPGAYDSMVAKLITHGPERETARRRMLGALDALVLQGFPTNVGFHRDLFGHPAFAAADMTTRFLEQHGFTAPDGTHHTAEEKSRVAALAAALAAAPGGVAAAYARQRLPPVVARTPGLRDRRSA